MSTHYFDRLHNFFVTISRCYKDVDDDPLEYYRVPNPCDKSTSVPICPNVFCPFGGHKLCFSVLCTWRFFLGQYQMAQPKFTITWNIFRPLLLPFVIWSSDPVARSLHFTPNPCPLAKEVTLTFRLLLLPYCPFAFEDYRLRLRHLVSHYWIIIGTAVSSNLNTYW